MPLAVPRYTLRDLESFPDDGSRYELLDGLLLVTPAPAPVHQHVVSGVCGALNEYLRPAGLARIYSPGVVELEPGVHLEPDILVVPTDALCPGISLETRWSDLRHWWLAVEVSGTGSTQYDRDFKGPAYLDLGVPEVWRVDLRERSLFISRPGSPERRCTDRITWQAPGMNRAMMLSVPELFLP